MICAQWRPVLAALALFCVFAATPGLARAVTFTVLLAGKDRVPPVTEQGAATATAEMTFDPQTLLLTWDVAYSGVRSAVTELQLRGPAAVGKNAHVMVQMGRTAQGNVQIASPVKGQATLTRRQASALTAGKTYLALNTTDHPGGELRAQLVVPGL